MIRKRYLMEGLTVMLIIVAFVYLRCLNVQSVTMEIEHGSPVLVVNTQQSSNHIQLWQDEQEGKAYFFLPSCVRNNRVKLQGCGDGLEIDGTFYAEGASFEWEAGREYLLQIMDEAATYHEYRLAFMKSANIPSLFINTESGSLEHIHSDKQNVESGDICVVLANGVTEYQDELLRISGRGNNTWTYEKKPYALKMREAAPLLGMHKSDRWQLLSLWRESSKMDNKVAMDIAEALGIPYAAQGTWIDLYMNGEYRGIYFLTESVTVGEGRVDIYNTEKSNKERNASIMAETAERYEEEDSRGYLLENAVEVDGGYLIEKVHPDHWETDESRFRIARGYHFAINSPEHASKEQVAYIRNCVEEIDQLVQDGDTAVWDKLDLASFTKLFLVDEISKEMDAGCASMYFYKDRGDGMLYAGPPWDYDNAFGEYDTSDGFYVDYHGSIADNSDRQAISLDWYRKLCDTPAMQRQIVEEYTAVLPFFERLLQSGIDEYADRIRSSSGMDEIRWRNNREPDDFVPRYAGYDANVSYLKFFLANRLNYLCEKWGVSHEPFRTPADGTVHQVTFSVYEGVVETIEVPDGAELTYTPEYQADMYQGWVYRRNGGKYSPYIPVYEDMEMYNAKWQ